MIEAPERTNARRGFSPMTIGRIAMAAHHIPDTTGCVYMIGRNKVFVPGVGALDKESFNIVMGKPEAWDFFIACGPVWAVAIDTTPSKPAGAVYVNDRGFRTVHIDCEFGLWAE